MKTTAKIPNPQMLSVCYVWAKILDIGLGPFGIKKLSRLAVSGEKAPG